MFDMFKGGKPDALTLMAVTQEERNQTIKEMIREIKQDLLTFPEDESLNIAPYVRRYKLGVLTSIEFEMVRKAIED